MANFQYGGQAVIEGVMMRGPDTRAVAVRRPDDSIIIDKRPVSSITKRYPFLKWPMVRGVVVLFESLIMGMQALSFSASQAVDDEEELSNKEIAVTMVIAIALAIVLFVVIPTGLTHFLTTYIKGSLAQNMVEGFLRLAVFLLYVAAIGRLEDIKRVFQYHGAEHKTINAYEAGKELTVDNVRPYPNFHPRCGTSFILIVLVVSIFLFASLGEQVLWWRILSRILLLPLLAGVSYELLKLSAKYQEGFICNLLITPGRWMQGLTTGEPDDSQIEVAIAALEAVLPESERSAPALPGAEDVALVQPCNC